MGTPPSERVPSPFDHVVAGPLALCGALVALVLLCGVAMAELFSRSILGLGDPPLYVADPQIEYMLLPEQDVLRFGNRILVNQWGMRTVSAA